MPERRATQGFAFSSEAGSNPVLVDMTRRTFYKEVRR